MEYQHRTHLTAVTLVGFPVEPILDNRVKEHPNWGIVRVLSMKNPSFSVIYPRDIPPIIKENVSFDEIDFDKNNLDFHFRVFATSETDTRLRYLEQNRYVSQFTQKNKNFLANLVIVGYYDPLTETFMPRSHYNRQLMRPLCDLIQDAITRTPDMPMTDFNRFVRTFMTPTIQPPPGFNPICEETSLVVMKKRGRRSPKRLSSPRPVKKI